MDFETRIRFRLHQMYGLKPVANGCRGFDAQFSKIQDQRNKKVEPTGVQTMLRAWKVVDIPATWVDLRNLSIFVFVHLFSSVFVQP